MKEKFYITTAIAYTSQKPHIGNVYEAVLTDAIARYKRQSGKDVFFLTGTDEHGQKIEDYAAKAGVSPRRTSTAWPARSAPSGTRSACPTTGLSARPTRSTSGWCRRFSAGCTSRATSTRARTRGITASPANPSGPSRSLWTAAVPTAGAPVTRASEEAYFLRLSKYQDRLIEYIETHDDFIVPASRRNEMINNFLRPGLQDLCVSRSSFKWGIPVDFDDGHVIYVWIDALSNYITAIGYDPDGSSDAYKKLWPPTSTSSGKTSCASIPSTGPSS